LGACATSPAPDCSTLLLTLASFVLAIASLGIDQTATSRDAAKHLGFGYPVHFAFSDFTTYYSPSDAQTFRLNPWEIPVEASLLGFVVSWLLVYCALLAASLLLRKALMWAVRQVRAPRTT
jgi:hypothetical protein